MRHALPPGEPWTPAGRERTWQAPVVGAALAIGLGLMGIQLWILTVALDLLLSGQDGPLWQLALASAAIFAGGLLVLRVLSVQPRIRG